MVVELALEPQAGGLELGQGSEFVRQEDRAIAQRADAMLDDGEFQLVRVEARRRRAQAAYPR
jgi:hypothetical protein